jgi:hypothetical protein
MKDCEEYRINMSALMDGELGSEDLGDTIRHLASCAACLKEFEAFQALQKRVNHEVKAPAVPARLWQAISPEKITPPKAISPPLRPAMGRLLRLAAVIVVCFGLGYMLSKPVFHLPKVDPSSPIVLASASGSMTEDRFLELTRELLTADPTYHRKMYLILSALINRFGEGNLQSMRESQNPLPVTPIMEKGSGPVETYKF